MLSMHVYLSHLKKSIVIACVGIAIIVVNIAYAMPIREIQSPHDDAIRAQFRLPATFVFDLRTSRQNTGYIYRNSRTGEVLTIRFVNRTTSCSQNLSKCESEFSRRFGILGGPQNPSSLLSFETLVGRWFGVIPHIVSADRRSAYTCRVDKIRKICETILIDAARGEAISFAYQRPRSETRNLLDFSQLLASFSIISPVVDNFSIPTGSNQRMPQR